MEMEIIIECRSCRGSGVYVGADERDGAAVVCPTCKGKGFTTFKYNEFNGLKQRDDVTRVYLSGYGYVIAPKTIRYDLGVVDMLKEGVSYEEWLNGKMPEHIRKLACPMLADQDACHRIKGFSDECGEMHGKLFLGIPIDKCSYQPNKDLCWKRFDSQSNNKINE
jgi:hypothetical protein